jgi:hypothetical protein
LIVAILKAFSFLGMLIFLQLQPLEDHKFSYFMHQEEPQNHGRMGDIKCIAIQAKMMYVEVS